MVWLAIKIFLNGISLIFGNIYASLVIQEADDQYGTLKQIDLIEKYSRF